MISLLLDNIRSVHNVGSIFRTAETIGVKKVYCVGTTPTPQDRFGRERADFAKVSLGAEKMVAWEQVKDESAGELIERLKKEGTYVIAVEQSPNSTSYKQIKVDLDQPVLIIFGNEVDGVSKDILSEADIVAEIAMKGEKESLNVSVAAGVVLFQWFG